MISAQELRIGNYVNRDIGRGYYQLVQLTISSLGYVNDEPNIHFPIPLTPEILENCGFVVDEDAGNWNEPEWTIYNREGFKVGYKESRCCYYRSSADDFYSTYWPELSYLHQLQNLLYAFTAQELTLNP